jgi:dnd system-associated protein 4
MPRRVRRADDQEELYKQLTEGDYQIFDKMKDVFMVAACLGVMEGVREPLTKTGGEIPWSVFHGNTDGPIIDSIALSETGDVKILMDDEETSNRKLEIVEEYANHGMKILKSRIIDRPGDPLENLVSLIQEHANQSQVPVSLSGLIGNLFE